MKSVPVEKWELTGEQLHGWYLEAVKGLQPGSFNPNANKPYSEMTEEQKSIDSYIAGKINSAISQALQAAKEERDKFWQKNEDKRVKRYEALGYHKGKMEERKRIEEEIEELPLDKVGDSEATRNQILSIIHKP